MSRYVMIRRLRGPAFLLLVGINALLAQANILGWGKSWPLYLILAGVLALAERAALSAEGGCPPPPYPGAPYPGPNQGPYQGSYQGQPYPGAPYAGAADPNAVAGQAAAEPGSAIVPAPSHDLVKDPDGGQS
jgi:hypothetical protein